MTTQATVGPVRIGITLGDPAGVGTEIALRSVQEPGVSAWCVPVMFGSPEVVQREVATLGLQLQVIECDPQEAAARAATLDPAEAVVVVRTSGAESVVPYGHVHAEGGEAAVRAVVGAVRATQDDHLDAICTTPLNKESMRLAGHPHDGHTELLAELTGSGPVSMLLLGEQLRVAHVSTHTALRNVPDKMTPDRLSTVVRIADEAVRRLGIERPRIAVAGLNPHAGENGLFGDEELSVMVPTIERLCGEGLDVAGPVSPDAVFLDMTAGRYDIVVVAYHDQGHIPVKLVERDKAVNVTGGLPIIRSSVDHGTAFDIAGRGIASTVNMTAALRLAAQLASGATRT